MKLVTLLACLAAAAVAVKKLVARSNTQVHRINQPGKAPA